MRCDAGGATALAQKVPASAENASSLTLFVSREALQASSPALFGAGRGEKSVSVGAFCVARVA
jgi:hypothetical protein